MPQKKGDIEIGRRMTEEVCRIFPTWIKAAMALGCYRKIFNEWRNGATPSGHYLAKLHYHGGDVIYVLTGKKAKMDGEREDNA